MYILSLTSQTIPLGIGQEININKLLFPCSPQTAVAVQNCLADRCQPSSVSHRCPTVAEMFPFCPGSKPAALRRPRVRCWTRSMPMWTVAFRWFCVKWRRKMQPPRSKHCRNSTIWWTPPKWMWLWPFYRFGHVCMPIWPPMWSIECVRRANNPRRLSRKSVAKALLRICDNWLRPGSPASTIRMLRRPALQRNPFRRHSDRPSNRKCSPTVNRRSLNSWPKIWRSSLPLRCRRPSKFSFIPPSNPSMH